MDPANRVDGVADVLVTDGRIARVGPGLSAPADAERIDATGQVVCPGLIDLHVHFREPGQTAKETIATGAQAAARGGFTTVVCMPNTQPSIDSASTVALIQDKARTAAIRVEVSGAMSKGIQGEELASIGSLAKAGVVALTDDGHCIQNNDLMRRALEYARQFGLPVMDHCQDYGMVMNGVMHEGLHSLRLGLRGWPAAGEELIVARNILLAEQTGTPVHCQHMSAAGSVRLIREAKRRGVPISGEACPHHLLFNIDDYARLGSLVQMNPSIKTASDNLALWKALREGLLQVVATDHAPHTIEEKRQPYPKSPSGLPAVENSLALMLDSIHRGRCTLEQVVHWMCDAPARVWDMVGKGRIAPGYDADLVLVDLNLEQTIRNEEQETKSRWSPWDGTKLKGWPVRTWVLGQTVYDHGRFDDNIRGGEIQFDHDRGGYWKTAQ